VAAGGKEDNDLVRPAEWGTAAAPTQHGDLYFGFYFAGLGNRLPIWYKMQGVRNRG
jgi:hypothetical protein